MATKSVNLSQTEAEEICPAELILEITSKKYPDLVLDGIAPETQEQREKATEAFFEWIDDNCRFMNEHVVNYQILSNQVERNEQNAKLCEKSDGDVYFRLLSAMDRTMIMLKDIFEELDAVNTYLLSLYSHSTSLIRRHIDVVEKMNGDEETTDEMFESFKFDSNIEIGGNAAKLAEQIKKLEVEKENSESKTVTFKCEESIQKINEDGSCNVTMKWSFKN
uniref:Uncharacterized protein n=1 Tax=Panagrolaimus sp. PS1159 TaxID=55785 RepID=A0AC35G9N7_9BILA